MFSNQRCQFTLAAAFPVLEQLYIGGGSVNLGYRALHALEEPWTSLWPQLKVFMYDGPHITAVRPSVVETLTALRLILALNYGGAIRHIGLDVPCENEGLQGRAYVFGESQDLPGLQGVPRSEFTSLQSLRLGGFVLSPAVAQGAFSHPILQTQSMRAIDIVFPAESLEGRAGEPSTSHLQGYAWLRGAEAIRSIGCYGFRFRSYPRNDIDVPLPAFLATFPNLETLALDSDHYETTEFVSLIAAILKVTTHLKTVYTTTAKGAPLDQLRAAAATQNVAIVSGRQPREFPIALDAN